MGGLPFGEPFYFTMLKDGERYEDILIGGYKIIQNENLYRFSSDAIILSRFAPKTSGLIADFCAGSGIVGIHYFALLKECGFVNENTQIDEFELQETLADMCRRSIEYNSLEKHIKCYNTALQDIGNEFNNKYSLILCNPPYKKVNSGEKNLQDHISVCRHEICITLEEITKIASKKLKNGGKLCICQKSERLTDLLVALRNSGLEPSEIQFVTAGENGKPYLVLVEATKGKRPQLKILPNYEN